MSITSKDYYGAGDESDNDATLQALYGEQTRGPKTQGSGVCGKCHRPLSNPASVSVGIGPVCRGKGYAGAFFEGKDRRRMWAEANYIIIDQNADRVLIKDIGPWDKFMTVTNAAESVVAELAPILLGRELHYIDSEGDTDQLLVVDGKFAGFKFIASAAATDLDALAEMEARRNRPTELVIDGEKVECPF